MKKYYYIGFGLILSILVLGLALQEGKGRAETAGLPTPLPTHIVPSESLPEEQMITDYQRLLQVETLDPLFRQSIEEKLVLTQRLLEGRLSGGTSISAPQSIAPPPVQQDPAFVSGIFEGGEGRFNQAEAAIWNYWQDIVNGEYVQIFAGSTGEEPQQGVIYKIVTSQDRMDVQTERIFAPGMNGKLHIISEEDLVLHIQSIDGTNYWFDIITGAFIPSP